MWAHSLGSQGRRVSWARALTLSGIGVLVAFTIALFAPWTASPAQAITQIQGGSGYPGDVVTVIIRNDRTGPTFTPWTVFAPPGTSIVSASGSAADGALPFPCTGSAEVVQCGPSGAGGWAANNTVTVILRIHPTAPVGYTAASSTITSSETGAYGVTVLAPPPPDITAPADGLRTLDRHTAISGTKRGGNSATALVNGVVACTAPADSATTWTCTPTRPLEFGTRAISATQTSAADDISAPSEVRSIEVLEPAALSIAHTSPTSVIPTIPVEHVITISNTGPGTASDLAGQVDFGDFPAATCTISGTATDCTTLRSGVHLDDLAPGTTARITIHGKIPAGTAAGTAYPFTSSISSSNDAASPITSTGTITAAAPPPARISLPTDGAALSVTSPTISGTALAHATVTVTDRSTTVVCTTTATGTGGWSCIPRRPFAVGQVTLRATQALGGLSAPPSAETTFTIVIPSQTSPPATSPSVTKPPRPQIPQPLPRPPHDTAPASGGETMVTPIRPMGVDIRFQSALISRGMVSTMRGTLGPNMAADPVSFTITGTVNKGMIYRSIHLDPGANCALSPTSFSCTLTLNPGESATIEIRLYADTLNAPPVARQQLKVDSPDPDQANAVTSAVSVSGDNAERASLLTLDIATFPGAFLPLLALLLFALAAWTHERTNRPNDLTMQPHQPLDTPSTVGASP